MNELLEEFCAVTENSVYHITFESDNHRLTATKIYSRIDDSDVGVGEEVASGNTVAIGKNIRFYEAANRVQPQDTSTKNWRWGTTLVVALCFTIPEALAIARQPNLVSCDSRWLAGTRKVLGAIGDDHPAFLIWKGARHALLPGLET